MLLESRPSRPSSCGNTLPSSGWWAGDPNEEALANSVWYIPETRIKWGILKILGHLGGSCELANSHVNVSMVCPQWEGLGRDHSLIPPPRSSSYTHAPSRCSANFSSTDQKHHFPQYSHYLQLYKLYPPRGCASECYTITESYPPRRHHRAVSLS